MIRPVVLVAAAGAVGFVAGVAIAAAIEEGERIIARGDCPCPACAAQGAPSLRDHVLVRDDWGRIRGG